MPNFGWGNRPVATDSPLASQYYGQGFTVPPVAYNPADIMAGVVPMTPGAPIPFGNFDAGQVNNFMWQNPGSFRLGNTGTVMGGDPSKFGGSSVSQADIEKMIQDAMNPFLRQLREQQTNLAEPRSAAGGPFAFLNAPMTLNKPVNGEFRRPSYGAPEDRGFYPGNYPNFNRQSSLPSTVPGLGGMFFDPYLATLAETLFGGSPWLQNLPISAPSNVRA